MTAQLCIRPARLDDYEQLMELLVQLHRQVAPVDHVRAREVFEATLDREGLFLLVAERDGRLVASCYLNVIPNLTRGARPYALIENVVTDQALRGQGLGQAVMGAAVERAWQAGCYKVMLMTGRKDEAVFSFYRRCGFSGDEKHAFIQRAPD